MSYETVVEQECKCPIIIGLGYYTNNIIILYELLYS